MIPHDNAEAKAVAAYAREMMHLTIPATYWDDYSERAPVDEPAQMAEEVKRAGNRVTISVDAAQLEYLLGDAKFYAEGNTDDTPSAVLRGARRVVELCRQINQEPT